MKKNKFLFIFLILLCSCQPTRDRSAYYKSYQTIKDTNNNNNNNNNSEDKNNEDSGNETETTYKIISISGTSSSITTSTLPSQCGSFSTDGVNNYRFVSTHLGSYNICFESSSNVMYFQVRYPITSSQVAIIPTHSDDGVNSYYIGSPIYVRATSNTDVYSMILSANRTGYQNSIINGVMIMKDEIHFFPAPFNQNSMNVDAYLFCSNFMALYNSASYCESFKSVGQYEYMNLLSL